jgi:hypothetical protein
MTDNSTTLVITEYEICMIIQAYCDEIKRETYPENVSSIVKRINVLNTERARLLGAKE